MTFWDVSFTHAGKTVHATFLGKPRPVADENTAQITGYVGKSPFDDPKKVVGAGFSLKRLYTKPLQFRKNQQLFLRSSRTVLREVRDVTWKDSEWCYYVTPVNPTSRATSEWIAESVLKSSKLAN